MMAGMGYLLLRTFLGNPIVLSALASFCFAQFVKAFIVLFGARKRSLRDVAGALFWKTGGMPSSHAALVSSMTAAVGFRDGIASDIFALSFFFSLVVLRDAVGVRRSSGLQAKSLNTLGVTMSRRLGTDFHPVKVVQGHRPVEVLVGGLLGVFIAGAVCFL
jgi:acid phosphatase family membrane protein YuiD